MRLWIALTLSCAVGLAVVPVSASEDGPLEIRSIRLYLPDAEMERRIGPDVAPLAGYIKALQAAAVAYWKTSPPQSAPGLLIVAAVRPGKKARVWCEAVGGEIAPQLLEGCERELGRVPAVDVQNGPIAFSVQAGPAGGPAVDFPAMPKSWVEASRKAGRALMVPDDVLTIVWPE